MELNKQLIPNKDLIPNKGLVPIMELVPNIEGLILYKGPSPIKGLVQVLIKWLIQPRD